MNFDLTHISFVQVVILTLTLTVVDFLGGVIPAIIQGKFDPSVVGQFLYTHVLRRVFPIVGLVTISASLGSTTAAGAAVWAVAMIGLAAYLAETVASLQSNLSSPTAAP